MLKKVSATFRMLTAAGGALAMNIIKIVRIAITITMCLYY